MVPYQWWILFWHPMKKASKLLCSSFFFFLNSWIKTPNLTCSSNAEQLMQLMQVKRETTSQPAHTSFCQATHSPSLPMLHVLTIISLSAWLLDSMINKELTAVSTVVLLVLNNTEPWSSFWLSRAKISRAKKPNPSYWLNQAATKYLVPVNCTSDLCFQWKKTQVQEKERSIESTLNDEG